MCGICHGIIRCWLSFSLAIGGFIAGLRSFLPDAELSVENPGGGLRWIAGWRFEMVLLCHLEAGLG
jgi:hypothetical protein